MLNLNWVALKKKLDCSKSSRVLFFLLLSAFSTTAFSQNSGSVQLSNYYNQELIYNDTSLHTVWKPFILNDTVHAPSPGTWFQRKFFHDHLVHVNQPDYNLYIDAVFDECIGKSSRSPQTPLLNTRGFEMKGNVGDKFYFETAFYENQARFGGYIDSFIRQTTVIPGQGGFKNSGNGKNFDFSSSEARLVYLPNKHFSFDLGYGKNFIGDGYRSVLLSDWSYNYPYFKATVNFGKFQYNAMWSQYISERSKASNNHEGFFRKWAQTFLLDWKATNHLSVSLFETVIWPDQDSMNNIRSKDISPWLASPVMFLHGNKSPSGLTNNDIAGANISYRILKSAHLYAQLALDNLKSGNSWQSRYAAQAGIRSSNLFGVQHLNVLLEGNMARPYMYSTNSLNTNYAHENQPLADPFGANFKEGLLVAEYAYKSWRFRLEGFIAQYGADASDSLNYGQNIFKPISTRTVSDNTSIGQGLSTNVHFADAKISYVLNPATNMRIEAGFTYRTENSKKFHYTDKIFYIGVRVSFRKIFYDF